MTDDLLVDPLTLRQQVRDKYRDVALDPHAEHHFHTGRPLAARLGYDQTVVDAFPDRAVESFAGVGNPFSLRPLASGSAWSTSVPAPGSTRSSPPVRSARPARSSAST